MKNNNIFLKLEPLMVSKIHYHLTYAIIYSSLNSAKLRARQKGRLAQRNVSDMCHLNEGVCIPEPVPPKNENDRDQAMEFVCRGQQIPRVTDVESNFTQPLDAPKNMADSTLRLGRLSNHKMSSHQDVSVNSHGQPLPDVVFQNHPGAGSDHNLQPSNSILPVLGVRAPSYNQLESSHRKLSRSIGQQSKLGFGSEFPFSLPPCSVISTEKDLSNCEISPEKLKFQDLPTETFQQHLKVALSDFWLPFSSVLAIYLDFHSFLSSVQIYTLIVFFFADPSYPTRDRF